MSLVLEPVGTEVARVGQRVDGVTWLANVNRHRRVRVDYLGPAGVHQSLASAMRMVGRWARAHEDRLRREVADRQVGLRPWASTPLQGAVEAPSTGP
jgi:hypothetical protein